ncbi:acylneuraminate cytidylyltransferase [Methanobacterium subterraneum]|uniref:Acylneuraminate cytidylyltransferase n=1 Tax=Methanobacterium subterraneum TaxID=59277 RepID=A0A2H4VD31_9EURY|nr:glycosyltransferase family protein [Methanobacterium subterraneum]AUB56004.1 acylneuraminate cytidylyltransferase [Methanobacterium subterraneum]
MISLKIGAIVQARASSTRLPEKVLLELPYGSGIAVLQQVIRRLKTSKQLNEIIIATTTKPEDKRIVSIAEEEDVKFFRGSEKDVLKRFYLSALENDLDVIVRVTSDCPCVDPLIVDQVIKAHLDSKSDYTSNINGGFPRGLDVEVFNFKVLETVFYEAAHDFEKEHVTPYIYKTHPEKFKITSILSDESFEDNVRLTLDTIEDYAFLCCLYDYFPDNNLFDSDKIVLLLKEKPWLKFINAKIIQKQIHIDLKQELIESIKLLDLQELNRAKKILEDYMDENIYTD